MPQKKLTNKTETEIYSDGSRKVTTTTFHPNGKPEKVFEFEYDKDGNKVKETSTLYSSTGKFRMRILEDFEYDAEGKKVKETTTEYLNGSDKVTVKTTKKFGGDGKMTESEFEVNTYNSNGKLEKKVTIVDQGDSGYTRDDIYDPRTGRKKSHVHDKWVKNALSPHWQ